MIHMHLTSCLTISDDPIDDMHFVPFCIQKSHKIA